MVRLSGTGLVVLSLLDREGTLVAWVVPPGGGGGVECVTMVLMEKREALARIADDWSDVPALISKVNSRGKEQQRTAEPACEPQNGPKSSDKVQLDETELLRLLYDICWGELAERVAGWRHVRIVPQGELLLVPWGALLDPNMSPLSARHVISLEPCLKGLIYLLNNMQQPGAAAAAAGPCAAKQREPIPSVSVDHFLGKVRSSAPNGALVVSDPYNAQHVRRSMEDVAREKHDAKDEEDLARSCAPLKAAPGGFDAVQEALDNPPPGGWLPRGMAAKAKAQSAATGCAGDLVEEGGGSQHTKGPGGESGSGTRERGQRNESGGHADQAVGCGGVSAEARAVTCALRAMGMDVKSLEQEQASPRMVLAACQEAGWIHLALPLVGGDPHLSDWVQGSGGESRSRRAALKRGQVKDEAGSQYDALELVLADGETIDGERDWGYVTAKRLGAEWRGKFAGATVVVAGRPQGRVMVDSPGNSQARAAGAAGQGAGEEEASDDDGGAELYEPAGARRLLKPALKREHGRAPPGPLGGQEKEKGNEGGGGGQREQAKERERCRVKNMVVVSAAAPCVCSRWQLTSVARCFRGQVTVP